MLIHRYDSPTRFVAGTVGAPGERTFFLQAREGNRLTSVALEKEQVAVLAERLEALLDEADEARPGGSSAQRPEPGLLEVGLVDLADPAVVPDDTAPLDQPIEEEFRVGAMTLVWEGKTDIVVIEAFAVTDDEDEEATDVLIVQLTEPGARSFVVRAKSVLSAGRAQCQFCGGPIDPAGHLCPRSNGYHRIVRG